MSSFSYLYSSSAVEASKLSPVTINNRKLYWSNGILVNNIPYMVIMSISCASDTFCVAVSSDGYIYTYRNHKWLERHQLDPNKIVWLTSISCPTTDFCMTVGSGGYFFVYQNENWSQPTQLTQDSQQELDAVSCTSEHFCEAVSYDGYAFSYILPLQS